MNGTLTRFATGDQGTQGVLTIGDVSMPTLELPWRDNARGRSCIPAGRYEVIWRRDRRPGKAGYVYEVTGVPGRFGILIHSGNLAGDEEKGWKTHVQGCLLVGRMYGTLAVGGRRQLALLASTPAVGRLAALAGPEPWELTVKEDLHEPA